MPVPTLPGNRFSEHPTPALLPVTTRTNRPRLPFPCPWARGWNSGPASTSRGVLLTRNGRRSCDLKSESLRFRSTCIASCVFSVLCIPAVVLFTERRQIPGIAPSSLMHVYNYKTYKVQSKKLDLAQADARQLAKRRGLKSWSVARLDAAVSKLATDYKGERDVRTRLSRRDAAPATHSRRRPRQAQPCFLPRLGRRPLIVS